MAQDRRILIVDDDANVRKLMRDGLVRMGTDWEIVAVSSGEEAVNQIRTQPFDLVITDLRMPGMHGLELARAIRELAPETQVILLTAYGSEEVERQASQLSIHSYLTKPVPIPTIRRIVHEALEKTVRARQEVQPEELAPAEQDTIQRHLAQLREQTGADCVLLISTTGYLVDQAGVTQGVDVDALAALVAANVAAMAEVARLLESTANFRSFFQESNDFNIYSHIVNQDSILIVVASPDVKTGLIWFYTRKTADALEPALVNLYKRAAPELDLLALNADLDSMLDFTPDLAPRPAAGRSTKAVVSESVDNGKRPTAPSPAAASGQPNPKNLLGQDGGDVPLLNLEEALRNGLLNAEFWQDLGQEQ